MGRHSAPDDDPDDAGQGGASVAVRERVGPPGRHSRHAEQADGAPDTTLISGHAPPRPSPVPHADAGDEVTLDELIAADDDTQRIPPVTAQPADVERPAPVTTPVSTTPPPGHAVLRGAAHNSAADLHLVRSNRGVLAAAALAVVLPFAVEVVVLVLLGHLDGHHVLVWLWAPLVAAGVLLGATLDLAHRRHTGPRR